MKNKFKSKNNIPVCIYGPPDMMKVHNKDKKSAEGEEVNKKKVTGIAAIISLLVATVTGCGKKDFDPSDNQNIEIYGPPEMFEQQYNGRDVSENMINEEGLIEEEYTPEENIPVCIYGPPEMFENEEENSENN